MWREAGRWSVSVTRPPRRPCPAFIDFLCALSISFVPTPPPGARPLWPTSDELRYLYLSPEITMPAAHLWLALTPILDQTLSDSRAIWCVNIIHLCAKGKQKRLSFIVVVLSLNCPRVNLLMFSHIGAGGVTKPYRSVCVVISPFTGTRQIVYDFGSTRKNFRRQVKRPSNYAQTLSTMFCFMILLVFATSSRHLFSNFICD